MSKNTVDLSNDQLQQVLAFIEEGWDPHVQRVDESTLRLMRQDERNYMAVFTILQSAGCAGPRKTFEQRVCIPVSIFR